MAHDFITLTAWFSIHYAGSNHILVAAYWGCSTEMFDYLLSKGVSPTDTDCRG